MDSRISTFALYALGAGALTTSLVKLKGRLALSKSKHRSLSGHARMARRLAAMVPFYEYDERRFFRADEAPDRYRGARARRASCVLPACFASGIAKTVRSLPRRSRTVSPTCNSPTPIGCRSSSAAWCAGICTPACSCSRRPASPSPISTATRFYDLTGSYGVNLFGYDFYKQCIDRAVEQARDLGPVLGAYHPAVAYNVRRLREISGLDEVSFHMSGTEAVMQAVRLARYHTRRTHLVRFCGAYHGWWGDVQPGIGNPIPARETYTLNDMSEDALRVLATRRDIACVLVNPLQALHPNGDAPSDTSLIDSGRSAQFDREAYAEWLRRLREVCSRRGIVLIFDEIFLGFRLAIGGAQEYFGVRADMVTYGKTLGGGFPVGVVCGRKDLMRRFRDDRPADICFARGTFNSHPYVMTAMRGIPAASRHVRKVRVLYAGLDETLERRARAAERSIAKEQICRCGWQISRRSGPCSTPSRRATIGCCNTICAPRAWR